MNDKIWHRIDGDPPLDDGKLILLSGIDARQWIAVGFYVDGTYQNWWAQENPQELFPTHWAPLPPYPTE